MQRALRLEIFLSEQVIKHKALFLSCRGQDLTKTLIKYDVCKQNIEIWFTLPNELHISSDNTLRNSNGNMETCNGFGHSQLEVVQQVLPGVPQLLEHNRLPLV